MQLLKELPKTREPPPPSTSRPNLHARAASVPDHLHDLVGERRPLLRRRSLDDLDASAANQDQQAQGGTILGIHNLAIVMPQFIVSRSRIQTTIQ